MTKVIKYLKPFTVSIFFIIIFVGFRVSTDLYLPNLMSDIVDTGIVNGDTDFILRTGGFMLLVAFAGGISSILSGYLSSRAAVGFGRNLRDKLFKKATFFSLHEVDQVGTASLITRTTNDIVQVQNVMVMLLRVAVMAPLMAVGSIIMALNKDVPLSGVIVVAIALMGIVIGGAVTKAIPLFKTMQKKVDKLNLVMRERLTGIRVIRAFNRVKTEEERFEESNRELTDVAIKVNKLMAIMMPFIMFVFSTSSVAIIWFGSFRVDSGAIQVGDLMAFIQYASQVLFSFMMLTMIMVMVPRASASAERIQEVLLLEPEITDPVTPVSPKISKGLIEFKDVTFYYHSDHEATEAAVSNISFTAKPGEYTAIIGGTGSGKSTLLNLIPRFYDVSEGGIYVDGVNVKDYSMEELRAKMSIVPQSAVLFTGTVAENIRYGKVDATDEEVKEAAEIARATEFIEKMDKQYDSHISQGGTNVSGGQKQRLSIARAVLRKPQIYLFDDSFSALDAKTESELRGMLSRHTKDATMIVVAQKVTSVMNADQIIVLDQGRITGIGTHKELLESSDVYNEIVASQLSKEEIANG